MDRFLDHVEMEFLRAEKLHGPINSLHEGYAVILEELDELWDEVRKKARDRIDADVFEELVQIAAMAYRTASNLGLNGVRKP